MLAASEMLSVIHRLLAAASGHLEWDSFLDELRRLFRAKGAQIVRVAPSNKELTFSALLGFDDYVWNNYNGQLYGRDNAMERYKHHFAKLIPEDPRIQAMMRSPNVPISCRLALETKQLHASRAYKEILSIADVEYSLVVNLPEEDGSSIMMGVFRGKDGTHFTQGDVTAFGALLPFVKQAVAISEEFSRLHLAQHLSHTVLDTMTVAIFIVTESKRIIYCNALAKALHEDCGGPIIPGCILRLKSKSEEENLRQAVQAACDANSVSLATHQGALTITRPGDLEPLSAIVVPKSMERKPIFGLSSTSQPLAGIFMTLPNTAPETPAASIGRLFNLTPSQAKLCELLVAGLSVGAAAERLSISHQTARVHLKNIYTRVGVNRQSELIAKILRTPLGLVRPPSAVS